MLIHTFWTARALPACLATPPCPGCATFAQQCLFTARQGRCLLLVTISIAHTICPTGPLLGVVALGEVRGNIELLESRGEARVQLVHPSSCSRVLRQGFNVGHKVLGDVLGPGKRDEVLGGLYGWESEEMRVFTWFTNFWAKHLTPCKLPIVEKMWKKSSASSLSRSTPACWNRLLTLIASVKIASVKIAC